MLIMIRMEIKEHYMLHGRLLLSTAIGRRQKINALIKRYISSQGISQYTKTCDWKPFWPLDFLDALASLDFTLVSDSVGKS